MPVSLLQAFDASELEFLTAGTLEIDVEDWKTHTEYRNGMYTLDMYIHVHVYMCFPCQAVSKSHVHVHMHVQCFPIVLH